MKTCLHRAALSWMLLVLLTVFSLYLGQTAIVSSWLVAMVMLTVVIKGQQIVDVFMGMSQAPSHWRMMLLAYCTVIPSVIAVIYSLD